MIVVMEFAFSNIIQKVNPRFQYFQKSKAANENFMDVEFDFPHGLHYGTLIAVRPGVEQEKRRKVSMNSWFSYVILGEIPEEVIHER